MSFFLCMHVVDYFVEYIHIFDTLLINYVPKLPPRLRSKRRCCCHPPPLADNHYHLAVLPPPSSLQRGKDEGAGLRRHRQRQARDGCCCLRRCRCSECRRRVAVAIAVAVAVVAVVIIARPPTAPHLVDCCILMSWSRRHGLVVVASSSLPL